MGFFTDGYMFLMLIPMAVVYALVLTFVLALSSSNKYSKAPPGARPPVKAFVFFVIFFCVSPCIVLPLFPIEKLFMPLMMKEEFRSWGPAKYLAGSVPFGAVCLGIYYFVGAWMKVAMKSLAPGAFFSILVLLAPMCSYAKVEYLSKNHTYEFRHVKDPQAFDGDIIVFLKVFKYGEQTAKTFGVACDPLDVKERDCGGSYYFYERERGSNKWKIVSAHAIWGGNSDDLPWPPY